MKNYVMASFDIKSLFTNIPLDETIDICINELFKDTDLVMGYDITSFRKLLEIASKDSIFLFNNECYKQTDGVAMGNPLGPTLSNIFLCFHERNWLKDCPSEFKPTFYRRYVDDTFLTFKSPDHIPLFLEYLNSKHPNIEFTAELEKDNSLPFLDVYIKKCTDGFTTSVYRKPTFTGLCTKFKSFIPLTYKRNLITTLTTRIYHICSTYFTLHHELSRLKRMLCNNGYPVPFIDKVIGKTLNSLLMPKDIFRHTVPRHIVYFPIEYRSPQSLQLRNKLLKVIRSCYPQITLRVIFKMNKTIQSFFHTKDKTPLQLESSVIYKYTCDSCQASYIGKTERHLKTRIHEHFGTSARTGKRIINPSHSAIREHAHTHDHPLNRNSFTVLDRARFRGDLAIMETLHTHLNKPTIGDNSTSVELLCF